LFILQEEGEMKKAVGFFICLTIITNCNRFEGKVIERRTTQELVSEFKNDWESAHKFYSGKRVEVTGLPVLKYREVIVFGEDPVGNRTLMEYENENITIECEFNTIVYDFNLNSDEIITVIGDYKQFINFPNVRSIALINCILVTRETEKNDNGIVN